MKKKERNNTKESNKGALREYSYKNKFTTISYNIHNYMKRPKMQNKYALYKLNKNWHTLVPEEYVTQCAIIKVTSSTIYIEFYNSYIAPELSFLKPAIKLKIKEILGNNINYRISFRLTSTQGHSSN